MIQVSKYTNNYYIYTIIKYLIIQIQEIMNTLTKEQAATNFSIIHTAYRNTESLFAIDAVKRGSQKNLCTFKFTPRGSKIMWIDTIICNGNIHGTPESQITESIEKIKEICDLRDIRVNSIDPINIADAYRNAFMKNPIIHLKSDEPWIHTVIFGDKMIKYLWDTRLVQYVGKAPETLIQGEDFEYIVNDNNKPVRWFQNYAIVMEVMQWKQESITKFK